MPEFIKYPGPQAGCPCCVPDSLPLPGLLQDASFASPGASGKANPGIYFMSGMAFASARGVNLADLCDFHRTLFEGAVLVFRAQALKGGM